MKRAPSTTPFIFLLFIVALLLPNFVLGQIVDTEKLNTAEKLSYCENTLKSLSGKPEEIANLIHVAESGLNDVHLNAKENYVFNQAAGIGYYYKQEFNKAKGYFEKAYEVANKAGLTDLSLKPLGNLIHINHYLGKQQAADSAAMKLLQIVNHNDSIVNKGDAFYNLGLYFQQQKFYYSVALNYFLKSIELHKSFIDTTQSSKLKSDYATKILMVVEIYIYLKQPNKALEYLNKVNPYLHQSNIIDIATYGKYLRAYALLNDKQKAIQYYNLLNDILEQNPGKWSEATSSNLKMAELSLSENNFINAKKFIDKADAQSKIDNKEIFTSSVNQSYGDYYAATKQYDQALQYYRNAEKGTAQFNKEQYVALLKSITEVLLKTGKIEEANKYFNEFVAISDSLTKQKLDINLAEMEAIFQNKEKQQQIEAQSTIISTVNDQKVWLSLGLGLLLLILVSVLIIYYIKRKAAKALNIKSNELERLNKELTIANHSKAKLFSIISHDLRSPISQVHTYLKLQQQNDGIFSPKEKEEYNKVMELATGQLLETMEDLLTWSKAQMNEFQIKLKKLALKEIVQENIQFFQLHVAAKHINITETIPEYTQVVADENVLNTIFRNLLQNAIKATINNGKIALFFEGNSLVIANSGYHFSNQAYLASLQADIANMNNSGFGLKLVDELSRKSKINISFDDTYTEGTKVLIGFAEIN